MHCLFFDVRPKPGHMDHYFDHVAKLKPILAEHEGLIYLERFRPLDDTGALLSHQLWRDEAAIAGWRQDSTHRASQAAGRRVHFEDYRIRVGPQVDVGPADGTGRFLVAVYGAADTGAGGRLYESVRRPGYRLRLVDASDLRSARLAAQTADASGAEAVRIFQINRDYTMRDRDEAPGTL